MDKKIVFIIGGGILAVILLIVFVVSSSGVSSSKTTGNKGPVVLTFWKTFEESEKIEPLFEEYKKTHPNVDIVYTKKNIENYKKDLLTALASGDGPDIFSINNAWLPEYFNLVVPAPDKTFKIKEFKDSFVDPVVEDFTKDNKIYGTAMAVDSLALFYNKDILGSYGIATPPKTWQELAQDVEKIKKADGKGYFTRSGIAMGLNKNVNRAVDILYLLMLQKGAKSFSSDGTQPVFNDSIEKNGERINPAQEALEFYTSFANPSSPNYNWNSRSDYSIDAFTNARSAFLISYSYTRDTIKAKNPNLNFDVAPIPQQNLDDPSVNFSNYWGEVVSKQSKNADVAWDFLKFLTSKKVLDGYYSANKQPSSRKDLVELQAADSEIGVFATANLTSKSFYRPNQQQVDEIFGKAIDNVILSGYDIDQALQDAENQISGILRQLQDNQ